MEEAKEEVKVAVRSKYSIKLLRNVTIVLLVSWLFHAHYKYVSTLFENATNFSHLSELEREMLLRTEMGFYYSYYKTVTSEKPLISGMAHLFRDRLVEHPKEINALNRFNIHPEVIIGALYIYLEPYINTTQHRRCHVVDRGDDLTPVESCVGIGLPMFFYLEAIWSLAGLFISAIFLHAVTLSNSILGGLLAAAQYFANHDECTRVQWTPNERENMAAPLFFLQTWCLTLQLRDEKKTSFQLQVSIFILNCLCLLFWQFSQFIFLTQTAIFFVMEQLRIIDLKTLCLFLHSHFCGIHMAVLLLQGNDMLKSSLYTSFFLVVSAYCLFFSSLRIKIRNRFDLAIESWLVVLRIAIAICSSIYLKKVISNFLEVEEDTHVWELLYSKLTNYKSFHTLIYTCSDVFDVLPLNSLFKMFESLLIPFVILSMINVSDDWIRSGYLRAQKFYERVEKPVILKKSKTDENSDDSGIENNTDSKMNVDINSLDVTVQEKDILIDDHWLFYLKNVYIDAAIFYNISQMVVFGLMAALVMRLKLLFSTQMCIVSSLILGTRYGPKHKTSRLSRWGFWIIAILIIIHKLCINMTDEFSKMGEFTNIPQEQLLQWIQDETSPNAAFAGSLPISASVMLSTRRPIVAHPHYEHKDARDRAYAVYKAYGRFTSKELYQELTKLKATYLIIEHNLCYDPFKNRCTLAMIWDIEKPSLASNPKLCHKLITENTEHFYKVFSNGHYVVFRIHDLSVRYMPRCFDT